jgi:phosphate transport system permease protein
MLERGFRWLCAGAALLPIVVLAILLIDLIDIALTGAARLGDGFSPGETNIWPAVIGSLEMVSITALIALPIGVGAAVYLEEYADQRFVARLIESNIANLAGLPSVIYGLLGLELFVRTLDMGRGLLAGALTMALLILPIVIIAAREALRSVPASLREAGLALGATRWQVVRQIVLPIAAPGILSGAILAVSRVIGEAAPVLLIVGVAFAGVVPDAAEAPFTVVPVQIFNWIVRPDQALASNAAAGILVLLAVLLPLNGVAIFVRDRAVRRSGGPQ